LKPLIQALAITLVMAILGPTLTFADNPEIEDGLCTYYGTTTDGYLGKRHAASWWGQTCPGFPETVDDSHFGAATRSRAIPFCARLELRITDLPKWAKPELNDLIGNTVTVTVIDRLPWDAPVDFDLWPAAFAALAGSSAMRDRLGICEVSVRIMKTRKAEGAKGRVQLLLEIDWGSAESLLLGD